MKKEKKQTNKKPEGQTYWRVKADRLVLTLISSQILEASWRNLKTERSLLEIYFFSTSLLEIWTNEKQTQEGLECKGILVE